MVNVFIKLGGMSPGTLRIISKETKANPFFQDRLRQLLEQPDPQKAVFQDMLEAIRVYVAGGELPLGLWWSLIDKVERFCEKAEYFPTSGDEGALLTRVLAALTLEAAVESKADKNLPWKTYAPKARNAGMGLPRWSTRAQKAKRKRHIRQAMLSRMTPEDRESWLERYNARKDKRKSKTLGAKFNQAFLKYGGIAGNLSSVVGGAIIAFAPWGTIIGAALIVQGMALTYYQKMELARHAAKARESEMNEVQDDLEEGKITEEEHTKLIDNIVAEEGEKLAAKGQLPPEEPPPVPEKQIVIPATKENIAKIVFDKKLPEKIVIPDAASLVNDENQYIIDQAAKLTEDEAKPVGLEPAKRIAVTQKRTKQVVGSAAAMMAAAAAVPFVIS